MSTTLSDEAPAIAGLSALAIDCADPPMLAGWWSGLLGGRVELDSDGDATLHTPEGLAIDFLRVPEAKTVKNRLHLDLRPVDSSHADEVERLIGLGARRADIGQGDVPWVVLADPEGNEFCVLGPLADQT
jgi:hypothetical protein